MNYLKKKTNYKNKTDWKCKIPHFSFAFSATKQINICKNKRKKKERERDWVRAITWAADESEESICIAAPSSDDLTFKLLESESISISKTLDFSTYSSSAISNKFNAIIKWDRNRRFEKNKQTNKI